MAPAARVVVRPAAKAAARAINVRPVALAVNARLAVRNPETLAARVRPVAVDPTRAAQVIPAAGAHPAAALVLRRVPNHNRPSVRIAPAPAGRQASAPSIGQAGAIPRAIAIGAGASVCCCRACF